MPSKPVPCTSCGRLRRQGGKTNQGVCRRCKDAQTGGKRHWAFSTQSAKQKAAQAPKTSWWLVPREQWGQAIADQADRLHGQGAQTAREVE